MLDNSYIQSVLLRDEKSISYEDYPFDIPAVRDLESITFHPKVTFL